jgi:cytochrome P450
MLLGPVLFPRLYTTFPFLENTWLRCSYLGWTNYDRGRVHAPDALGPAFILICPNRTEFYTTDPNTSFEVSKDWKTFTRPGDLYQVFDIFGKNVNTVNGPDWPRHRKITGGAFERQEVLRSVWEEARRRASELATTLVPGRRNGGLEGDDTGSELNMTQTKAHMSLLTMSVLSVAAFGKAGYSAADSKDKSLGKLEPGHTLTYFDTARLMFENLMGVIVFGSTNLPRWLLPPKIKQVRVAVDEYSMFLKELLNRVYEQKDVDPGALDGNDLASMIVRANEAEKAAHAATQKAEDGSALLGSTKPYLTESELYGNMFMFNIAGYESTSMVLNFTIAYLAKDEALLHWVKEEVDAVVKELGGLDDYEACFQRLVRTRALMVSQL